MYFTDHNKRIAETVIVLTLLCFASAAQADPLCSPGYYNPDGGLLAGEIIDPGGYYTNTPGQLSPTFVPGGYYANSPIGATGIIPSPAGYYAPAGSTTPIACPAGYYTPGPGYAAPLGAPPGYYAPDGSTLLAAPPGTYAPAFSASPIACSPGYYTPGSGYAFPLAAPPGYYVPDGSASSAIPAPIGTFAPGTGSTAPLVAPPGTWTHVASVAPRATSASHARGDGYIVGPDYESISAPASIINVTDGGASLLITNASNDLGTQDSSTALSLLSAELSGPDPSVFSVGALPVDALFEQQQFTLPLGIATPDVPAGVYTATLTILTDQDADFGDPGQQFTYTLSFTAVPEPASMALVGVGVFSLVKRRHRALMR